MATRGKVGRKPKKIWLKIYAPDSFDRVELGETPVVEPEQALYRTVELPIPYITGDMLKPHIFLKFRIYRVTQSGAETELIEYRVTDAHLKRLIRRKMSKVEVVKDVTFKDGIKARVKVVVCTQYRAHRSQKTGIRKAVEQELEEIAKGMGFEEFVHKCIDGEIQARLKEISHKVFPVKNVEVRRIQRFENIAEMLRGTAAELTEKTVKEEITEEQATEKAAEGA